MSAMFTRSLLGPLQRASSWAAIMAGGSVALLSVLIMADIVLRTFFGFSVQGTDELGGYVLTLIGSLGLAHALIHRGHPRIDIGLKLFPLRLRALLHVLALAAMAAFAIFAALRSWAELSQTIAYHSVASTPLETPLWIPQTIWVAGQVFFAIVATVLLLHAFVLSITDSATADRLYGPPSVEEEVEVYTGPQDDARDTKE